MGRLKVLPAALLAGILCIPAWGMAAEPGPVMKGIRVVRSGENLGVEITADRNLDYSISKMPQLLRIVVDLPRTDPGRPDTVYKVESAAISSIRIEKKTINDVMVTRVSINLAEDADFVPPRPDPVDRKKVIVFLTKPAPRPAETPAVAPAATAPETASAGKQAAAEQLPAAPAPAPRPPTRSLVQAAPASAPAAKPAASAPVAAAKPAAQTPGKPVMVGKVTFGEDAIEIEAGGAVEEFRAFTLREPGRLVIDIPAARSGLRAIDVPANRLGVVRARVGVFEEKLRLVFETGSKPFPLYCVVRTGTGLKVVLKGADAQSGNARTARQ